MMESILNVTAAAAEKIHGAKTSEGRDNIALRVVAREDGAKFRYELKLVAVDSKEADDSVVHLESIDIYIDADAAQPDRTLAYIWQDGLGLPDRDYYLSDSPELTDIRTKYREHIDNLLVLAGWSDSMAAQTIIAIEKRLAENHWSQVQNRDREQIYSNQFTQVFLST